VAELCEIDLEQALAYRRGERLADLRGDLRRRAFDRDLLDRERRRRPRCGVEADRGQQDQEADEQRTAGGNDPGQLEAITYGAAGKRQNGACRARTRARTGP
jgi:hypothetical protein